MARRASRTLEPRQASWRLFIGANAKLNSLSLRDADRLTELKSFSVREIEAIPFGPVEHGSPLGRYVFECGVAQVGFVKVGVLAHLTFNVLLAEGSPAAGRSVTDVCESLIETVTAN